MLDITVGAATGGGGRRSCRREGLYALPGGSLEVFQTTRDAYGLAIAAANVDVENNLVPVAPAAPDCTMRK